MPGHRITLTGEKQTLLITLYAKALDSRLDDSILHDRFAEEAVRQIDFDFSRVALGKGNERALAMRRIHTDYASALDIDTLAREANMSVSTFHHNFKAMTFTSPLQYLKSVRLYKAWSLMVQDGLNASTAANQVGYESPSQFSREFKRYFGRTPSEEVQAARR